MAKKKKKSHKTTKKKSKKKETRKKSQDNNYFQQNKLLYGVAALLMLFALYNFVQASSLGPSLDERMAAAKEAARPAELEMVTLSAAGCGDCYDVSSGIENIKSSNVNITSEETVPYDSEEGKSLIEKYGVEGIPTVLLFGETNKTRVRSTELRDDALVFSGVTPPYVNPETGRVVGSVKATILENSGCDNCFDINQLLSSIEGTGVAVTEQRTVNIDSEEGQTLVSKYNLQTAPALILSSDLEVYSQITEGWSQFGEVASDGNYVTKLETPPYYDLQEQRIVGLVNMVVLHDSSCEECYDAVPLHTSILQRIGVALASTEKVDVNSEQGASYVEQYDITSVPVTVLTGDMKAYPVLKSAWDPVGTIEENGAYVFRSPEFVGQPYKNLETGEVVQ